MNTYALFKHASIGIIITDSDGCIVKCNPYAASLLGYDFVELVNKNVRALFVKELGKKILKIVKNYSNHISNEFSEKNTLFKAKKKFGEEVSVEIGHSHYYKKNILRVVFYIQDISQKEEMKEKLKILTMEWERKIKIKTQRLQDELMELDFNHKKLEKKIEERKEIESQIRMNLEMEKELGELKSRFVSIASHEFRTPLGGIMTSVSLIEKYHGVGNTEKLVKHVNTIKKSVKNLTTILNEFLSLDKLDQGVIETYCTSFSLAKLCRDTFEEMGDLKEKNQVLNVIHEKPELIIIQNESMLRNVLINLLSNAVKYSSNGSEICFHTTVENNSLIIKVIDYGIGIPANDQKHLFARFFRAKNVNNIQGTGLGLNIVKRYMDIMGGKIEFESEENKGTTFKLILPLEEE